LLFATSTLLSPIVILAIPISASLRREDTVLSVEYVLEGDLSLRKLSLLLSEGDFLDVGDRIVVGSKTSLALVGLVCSCSACVLFLGRIMRTDFLRKGEELADCPISNLETSECLFEIRTSSLPSTFTSLIGSLIIERKLSGSKLLVVLYKLDLLFSSEV